MNKQTHRTCVRMSAKEYNRLMERSRAAGLSANAWLMEQLAGNRPIMALLTKSRNSPRGML